MTTSVLPSTNELLADARYILGKEMSRLKRIAHTGVGFTMAETNQLRTYIRTLIEMDQEERAAAAWEAMQKLTDGQIAELAREIFTGMEMPDLIASLTGGGK